MPYMEDDNFDSQPEEQPLRLPFPPLTRQHILNCSYHSWYPKYRSFAPKSRVIPLTKPFVDYLQADGIYLPTDDSPSSLSFSNDDDEGDDEDSEPTKDVAQDWRPLHETIKATIKELGGKVLPKLNWSAPKDATHMLGNSMNCYSADDVYLLLKSSDFIAFDLNHAFDDTTPTIISSEDEIPFHLILRKSFNLNPSLEFRCFVRNHRLIALTQRDMNYYDFLHKSADTYLGLIEDFFDEKLKDTFGEANYVFDVYVPERMDKVWLIDINPWAQRTDPLLFSWRELLEMDVPEEEDEDEDEEDEVTVRLRLASLNATQNTATSMLQFSSVTTNADDNVEELWRPELRLLNKDDPESYQFASAQYSAHKMPKDIVDAASGMSVNSNALRELSAEWKDALERARQEDEQYNSDEERSG